MLENGEHNELDSKFEDAFQNFEEQPSSDVWSRVEGDLDALEKKKDKRMLLFYKWTAAASLIIAIALGTYTLLSGEGNEYIANENKVSNQTELAVEIENTNRQASSGPEFKGEQQPTTNNLNSDGVIVESDGGGNAVAIHEQAVTEKHNSLAHVDVSHSTSVQSSVEPTNQDNSDNHTIPDKKFINDEIALFDKVDRISKIDGIDSKVVPSEDEIEITAEEIPIEELGPKRSTNKWSLGASYSPDLAYRSLGSGSPLKSEQASAFTFQGTPPTGDPNNALNNSYFNNIENPKLSYTSGLRVNYGLSNKWELQSGVMLASLGQVTNTSTSIYSTSQQGSGGDLVDASFTNNVGGYQVHTSAGVIADPGVDLQQSTTISIQADEVYLANGFTPLQTVGTSAIKADESLQSKVGYQTIQSYNYVSVPVVTKYRITDRKLKLGVSGGLAANFLVGNQTTVYYKDGENSQAIIEDKIDNLNPVLYSGLISVGAEYELGKRFLAGFEPTFRYSLSPLNKSYGIRSFPYSFGIASGITYKF